MDKLTKIRISGTTYTIGGEGGGGLGVQYVTQSQYDSLETKDEALYVITDAKPIIPKGCNDSFNKYGIKFEDGQYNDTNISLYEIDNKGRLGAQLPLYVLNEGDVLYFSYDSNSYDDRYCAKYKVHLFENGYKAVLDEVGRYFYYDDRKIGPYNVNIIFILNEDISGLEPSSVSVKFDTFTGSINGLVSNSKQGLLLDNEAYTKAINALTLLNYVEDYKWEGNVLYKNTVPKWITRKNTRRNEFRINELSTPSRPKVPLFVFKSDKDGIVGKYRYTDWSSDEPIEYEYNLYVSGAGGNEFRITSDEIPFEHIDEWRLRYLDLDIEILELYDRYQNGGYTLNFKFIERQAKTIRINSWLNVTYKKSQLSYFRSEKDNVENILSLFDPVDPSQSDEYGTLWYETLEFGMMEDEEKGIVDSLVLSNSTVMPTSDKIDEFYWKINTGTTSDYFIDYIKNAYDVIYPSSSEGGDIDAYTKQETDSLLNAKQDKMTNNYLSKVDVGGSSISIETKSFNGEIVQKTDNINFKTINGQGIFGMGDIKIEGGGGSVDAYTKAESDDKFALKMDMDGLKLKKLTQSEYDSLSDKDNNTLYVIV